MGARRGLRVDHVLPHVPVRQWVLTLPHRLRYLLAYNHALCRAVLGVAVRAVLGFYRRRARRTGVREPRCDTIHTCREPAVTRDPFELPTIQRAANTPEHRAQPARCCPGFRAGLLQSWPLRLMLRTAVRQLTEEGRRACSRKVYPWCAARSAGSAPCCRSRTTGRRAPPSSTRHGSATVRPAATTSASTGAR